MITHVEDDEPPFVFTKTKECSGFKCHDCVFIRHGYIYWPHCGTRGVTHYKGLETQLRTFEELLRLGLIDIGKHTDIATKLAKWYKQI